MAGGGGRTGHVPQATRRAEAGLSRQGVLGAGQRDTYAVAE